MKIMNEISRKDLVASVIREEIIKDTAQMMINIERIRKYYNMSGELPVEGMLVTEKFIMAVLNAYEELKLEVAEE